jgi:16S rRNA G966 N2-methylase RsmD
VKISVQKFIVIGSVISLFGGSGELASEVYARDATARTENTNKLSSSSDTQFTTQIEGDWIVSDILLTRGLSNS